MPKDTELSERERGILKLVATGVSNKEIAGELRISTNTVKVHLRNIFSKIGTFSRTEATLYAIEHGIVDAPGNGVYNPAAGGRAKTRSTRNQRLVIGILIGLSAIALIGLGANYLSERLLPTASPQTVFPTADPVLRWTKHAPLPEGRAGMAATVYDNQVYLIAGMTRAGITGSSLRYDIQADRWYAITHKPSAVTDIKAVLIGEKIYIPGGRAIDSVITNLEVYDPQSDSWEEKAHLPLPLSGYAATAFEGELYIFGGWDGTQVTDGIFRYDPQADEWSLLTRMSTARAYMGAELLGGKVYIIGGWDGKAALTDGSIFIPNRISTGGNAWFNLASLPVPLCRIAISSLVNSIFVAGVPTSDCASPFPAGSDPPQLVDVTYQYNSQNDTWLQIELPDEALGTSSAIITNNEFLYKMGGFSRSDFHTQNFAYQAIYTTSIPIIISP